MVLIASIAFFVVVVCNAVVCFIKEEDQGSKPEALNRKALQIVNRVRDKLTGRDFNKDEAIEVEKQVELLIQQATSHVNLCQAYIGWYVH